MPALDCMWTGPVTHALAFLWTATAAGNSRVLEHNKRCNVKRGHHEEGQQIRKEASVEKGKGLASTSGFDVTHSVYAFDSPFVITTVKRLFYELNYTTFALGSH